MIALQLRNSFVPARDLTTRQSRPRNAPTFVTIEHKNFLIETSSYPGPESEDSDERIILSTPPSQRTPATGSNPTPELGDTTHSLSPTHEPRNVDNSPLLSLPFFILLPPPLMHSPLRLPLLMAPMPRAKLQVQQWITDQRNSVLALPHFLPPLLENGDCCLVVVGRES